MTDVCLILEGTYPYVPGGVSSCVRQLIEGTPNVSYGVVYIGAKNNEIKEYHYPIPANVDYVKEIYLYEDEIGPGATVMGEKFRPDIFAGLQDAILKGTVHDLKPFYEYYFSPAGKSADGFDLLKCRESWDWLVQHYYKVFGRDEGPPFIDFFYNWRYTNYPIYKILSSEIPHAGIYHSLSTGYAGLLGVLAKMTTGKPFVLTEHGIYSHEREIEISKADWLLDLDKGFRVKHGLSYFKDLWINMFHFMSKTAYANADTITTLYQGNREKQIRFGAPAEKIQIIPNGIKCDHIDPSKKLQKKEKTVLGLVGRVVPIKDVKTFIKTISVVNSEIKNLEVLVLWPYDEDPEYYLECKTMIEMLGLENVFSFKGMVNMQDYYPGLDMLVMSSISEGQPMVILEAFAWGIPCVTTDVGSCRELVLGMGEEDSAIGPAGDVAPFGRPDLLAKKIISILSSPETMAVYGKSARERVQKYYKEEHYLNNNLNLYNRFALTEGRA